MIMSIMERMVTAKTMPEYAAAVMSMTVTKMTMETDISTAMNMPEHAAAVMSMTVTKMAMETDISTDMNMPEHAAAVMSMTMSLRTIASRRSFLPAAAAITAPADIRLPMTWPARRKRPAVPRCSA